MKLFDQHAAQILSKVPPAERSPVCVELSNVAYYLYRDNPKEYWSWEDFPNVAPPWPCAWYEWVAPRVVNSEGKLYIDNSPPSRNGVLAISRRKENGDWVSFLWLWVVCPAIRRLPLNFATVIVPISAEGVIDWRRMCSMASVPHSNIWCTLFPYCLGVSFAHCRNVELVDVAMPEAVRKKRQRRGVRCTVFKTLEIRPMKEVLRKADPNPGSGLKQRLHICRGHFKDYRAGRGLFGKYCGMFWWDMHLRGDGASGEVKKDYMVAATERICG
jgi:hypothetical protein